jgi:GTP-binding protein EngB required for normal cell division
LGKLKVLVTGDSGVGKSELIRALTDVCPDIVYVEDGQSLIPIGKDGIVEIQASSKPCPLYCLPQIDGSSCSSGSAIEGGGRNSRRASILMLGSQAADESALDRNVCFVDTPGYGLSQDSASAMDSVESYLEAGFRRAAEVVNVANPTVALGVLTNATSLKEFTHVDACLYMVLNRIKQVDIEYMRRINQYTPVIPVIAKSDQLDDRELLHLKIDVLKEMKRRLVAPFMFGVEVDEAVQWCEGELQKHKSSPNGQAEESLVTIEDEAEEPTPGLFPCAVSCLRNMDAEMVASVVMAPDYYPPPVDSELHFLCKYLFSEQGAAWLRHTSAQKFAAWTVAQKTSTALIAAAVRGHGGLITTGRSIEVLQEFMQMPSAVISGRDRAQQQTARWAMEMEQEMRSEKALVHLASEKTGSNQPSSPDSPNSPQRDLPYSISNLDPLGFASLIGRVVTYAAEAVAVAVGLRLATIYFWTQPSTSPPPPPQSVTAPEPLFVQMLRAIRAKWIALLS